MNQGRFHTWVFVAATVFLPLAVFAVVKWCEHNYAPLPYFGKQAIASFELQDQHGEMASLQQWRGHIVVADFFFTHCPTVCPKMTRSLKKVQQVFAVDTSLLIRSFSVDPDRDSPRQLSQYAEQAGISGNWQLITGDKKQIYQLARKSFMIVATDGDGGPNDFIHSELLVLVDKQQRIRGYYNGTDKADVEALIRVIARLKKEN